MPEFHQTRMGVRFYERDVPEIALQLARIADALERLATNTAPAPAEGEDPRDADAETPNREPQP